MIRIGICDDDAAQGIDIEKKVKDFAADHNRKIETRIFNSAETYLKDHEEIDLLLLDIEMPGLSGIELKEVLPSVYRLPAIIFVSSHPNRMAEAFGPNVLGFLTKPLDKGRLAVLLTKVLSALESVVKIPVEEGYVLSSDVIHVMADNKYVDIVTTSGIHSGYISLGECENILPSSSFVRVNRSNLVNFEYVSRFKEQIEMCNGDKIKIARGRTKEFKDKYEFSCVPTLNADKIISWRKKSNEMPILWT